MGMGRAGARTKAGGGAAQVRTLTEGHWHGSGKGNSYRTKTGQGRGGTSKGLDKRAPATALEKGRAIGAAKKTEGGPAEVRPLTKGPWHSNGKGKG